MRQTKKSHEKSNGIGKEIKENQQKRELKADPILLACSLKAFLLFLIKRDKKKREIK